VSLRLSVVICTHNPRTDHLRQTVDSLRRQTLPTGQWELILIDNASTSHPPPSDIVDWHPCGRLVVEPELGLTPARLRGIAESSGSLLVFVDDDNVLHPDYLASAIKIAMARPYIGAFGGNVIGKFEIPPARHLVPYLNWLALLRVENDHWGNARNMDPLPVGAGLCVRREVALQYSNELNSQLHRRKLDRRGAALVSGGDNDLILTAMEMGLGAGIFISLELTHLIPRERLTDAYFVRMAEGMSYSQTLRARMGRSRSLPPASWRRKLLALLRFPFISSFHRKLTLASRRGQMLAQQLELPLDQSFIHAL
jgi:glycosyltransferase involved in cell wall biosynthesis